MEVTTGKARFIFHRGGAFPFSAVVVDDAAVMDQSLTGLYVGLRGEELDFVMSAVELRERGPLRAEVEVRAVARGSTSLPLELFGRVELFAGTATARVAVTIRNTRRAQHPGGRWVLGDAGSVLVDHVSLVLSFPDELTGIRVAAEFGSQLDAAGLPLEIYQDSSGGDQWNHRTHVNRNGTVPVSFRGYRLQSAGVDRSGLRASPIIVAETHGPQVAIAVPEFWQNFPRAVAVEARTIELGLFPRQFADEHELQGGEQKTHVIVIAFAPDEVSNPPLAWAHDPVRVYPAPEWCCETDAVPFLTRAANDDAGYRALVETALDSERGFVAKRERFDEYGWRHFGDIPSDHESAFQPPDRPFVSHYNNQYDALGAFAVHFLRSGDARWWLLMDALARHVRDIDIYHTREDKAAYDGGLFWHTEHYMDAGLSTHRTYPTGSGGGGPSAEHNYTVGLMLHYFMTGDIASRDAAVGLATWVVVMDDGRLTPFRWLSSGPTGLASATGSMTYHGPGRGPANSIVACLVAHRLTGDDVFVRKADELIRRCIHPADDLEARNLFDVERRWYYTVFLQALGTYLHEKWERREIDEMYGYARASLLHYARWMAEHERPYLSRPDVLEFPTETWVAQDVRKADVLFKVSSHVEGQEQTTFLERAGFFYQYVAETLAAAATRHFARPLVILLAHSVGWSHLRTPQGRWAGRPDPPSFPWPQPVSFEPQRAMAKRRLKRMVSAAVALAILLVAIIVARW